LVPQDRPIRTPGQNRRRSQVKKIILLLGGARSGKSHFAQEYARQHAQKVLFVATATAGDEDMRIRIEQHKKDRPATWNTLEASDHIGKEIEENINDEDLVIVDCITLLINNIFGRYDETQFDNLADSVLENQVMVEIRELINCLNKAPASFVLVSNEVGLGIVPDNRMSRIYRDLLGRANQMLAQKADEVYLMVAGIPLRAKNSNP
jgi:adenosylcobinamide kinase / adenosylcobinamide-phosphate guanylyltransferase